MNTVEDLKRYIQAEYGVSPNSDSNGILQYRAISFERGTASVILANKKTADMWTVKRAGHSIDHFRTEELEQAISPSGSLLYWFMPESRI